MFSRYLCSISFPDIPGMDCIQPLAEMILILPLMLPYESQMKVYAIKTPGTYYTGGQMEIHPFLLDRIILPVMNIGEREEKKRKRGGCR